MNWHYYFNYKDGKIFWKAKPADAKPIQWNGKREGFEVGTLNKKGYVNVKLNMKMYKAHRIIWEMHNGEIPKGMQIDHINRIRNDNRIENLRLATNQENQRNCNMRRDNSTGYTGVHFHKLTGRYYAHIGVDGETITRGPFNTPEQAYAARLKMNSENNFSHNHGKTITI